MRNFVITAATISGNKGAESMFTAVYQNMLKIYPESHFYLLSYYPKIDKNFVYANNISILPGTPLRLLFLVTPLALLYRLFRVLRFSTNLLEKEPIIGAIARSDLVFDVGGITFSDGREIYLPFNIVTILPSILMKKKTIKCAQAMGPFNRFLNKVSAKWFLPKIDLIFARGKRTMEHLNSIGLHNTMLTSDIAFSMNIDDVDISKIERYIPTGDNKTVGISPSSVVYKYCSKNNIDYIGIMARFCDFLVRKWHLNIILMPHSIRKGNDKLKNNDLPVIRKLIDSISNKDNLIIIDEDLSASELRAIMEHCDFFVASRFHSMVSALSVKVPLIVCGWGHKYLEVLLQFGLEEYVFDYKNLSLETILSKFEQLIKNEVSLHERINRLLPEVLKNTYKHFEESKRIVEYNE